MIALMHILFESAYSYYFYFLISWRDADYPEGSSCSHDS